MVEKEIEDIDTPEFKTAYNNLEEAAKYLKEVTRLTDKFMSDITGFDRYTEEGTYEWYVQHVYPELKNWTQTISKMLVSSWSLTLWMTKDARHS